jgi:hypothetical protein
MRYQIANFHKADRLWEFKTSLPVNAMHRDEVAIISQ